MSKTFCLYPFMNLNSNTEGSVKLCCSINENIHVKGKDGKELNFESHTLEEIWRSDYMKDIRNQMLAGERPEACDVCWRLEDMGLNSSRLSAWGEFKDLNIKLDEIKCEDPPLPSSLELRLGNFCNLRCNSCWSLSSDRILNERKKMLKDKELLGWMRAEFESEVALAEAANFAWWESPNFMETVKKVAPTLKRLYLTGGEPTLIKKNIEVMQMILDAGNTDCYVALTTNLTNWDNDFFSTMGKFKHGEFQISIDATGDKNWYIRFPTHWQNVENNLAAIYHSFPVEWKIKHYTVLQVYNYDQVPEIIKWVRDQRKWWSTPENLVNGMSNQTERIHIWSPIILDQPKQLNIRNMPLDVRLAAAEELEQFLNVEGPTLEESPNFWYKEGVQQAIKYMRAGDKPNEYQWIKFFQYCDLIDKHRSNTSFAEVFPSLAALDPRKIIEDEDDR
jgi:sulfatase maturation enzyme AslB (radical SAM superfamily)